jgi:UDP-N-acetylmuramoyl-tripeptide--D-alanyl-D-alanine ligase
MIWNSDNAEIATNGKSTKKWKGNKLVIDSRLIEKDDIFVALKGGAQDGHNYVKEAIDKGAAVAIVSHIPKNCEHLPLLIVDNVEKAITDLAKFKRSNLHAKFIAVTGSVGKTSTKELLSFALQPHGITFASRGNYNNHLGVPINIASIPDNAEYVIIEMGMERPEEIRPLSILTKPDMAIITNIFPVHTINFKSLDEVALAKAEIFDGLQGEKIIILNKNSDQFNILLKAANNIANSSLYEVGKEGKSYIIDYNFDNNLINVKAKIVDKLVDFTINGGKHLAENAIMVLCAVSALGLELNKSANNLINFSPLKGRGRTIVLNDITVIDESYNASPEAVRAALKVLGQHNGRKIAILADMLDLGTNSTFYHQELKTPIEQNNIDHIITYGKEMKHLYNTLSKEKKLAHFDTLEMLISNYTNMVNKGDIVLIKGSYGTKIHELVAAIESKGI